MCMGRGEGALGRSCYRYRGLSLYTVLACASLVAWPSEWEPWLLDLCFCSALTGVVRWSVLESLVRGVWCPLTHTTTCLGGARGGRGRCARVMRACSAAFPRPQPM
jgi:hypothetical protein